MKKVKNILLRLNLEGYGIVNYDGSEQGKYLWGTNLYPEANRVRDKNVTYAKKKIYKKDDKVSYKIVISSNCLRHGVFSDVPFQTPNIGYNKNVLYSFIASPTSILRGYLMADKNFETLKRKGPLCITDAQQTCGAISTMETFTRSGRKLALKDESDNSFFKKETIGNISYQANGSLDLEQLQFVSCDPVFDRYSFNPDEFELYKNFLGSIMDFNSELGEYKMSNSRVNITEYGFKFSDDNVVFLVKEMFKKLMGINIKRNNAFAKLKSLEYKLVYNPLEDISEDDAGWITINTEDDIKNISFVPYSYYNLMDDVESKENKLKLSSEHKQMVTDLTVAMKSKSEEIVKGKKEIRTQKKTHD